MTDQDIVVEKETMGSESSWHPPMSWWRYLLLMICSFSLYSLVFVYKTYKDLNENIDNRLSPGWHVVGFLIPVVSVFLYYHFCKKIESISSPKNKIQKFPIVIMTFIFAVLSIYSFAADDEYILIGMGLYLLPWMYLQHRLNINLASVKNTRWRKPENRFSILQRSFIFISSLSIITIFTLFYLDMAETDALENIRSGSVIIKEDYPFQLPINQEGWKYAKKNSLSDEAELELVHPESDAWAIIFVSEAGDQTIDDKVSFRYSQILENEGLSKLETHESRSFLPGTDMIPVSYTKYQIDGPVISEIWYVATIHSPKYIIEMISYQIYDKDNLSTIARLVNGLTLLPKVEDKK